MLVIETSHRQQTRQQRAFVVSLGNLRETRTACGREDSNYAPGTQFCRTPLQRAGKSMPKWRRPESPPIGRNVARNGSGNPNSIEFPRADFRLDFRQEERACDTDRTAKPPCPHLQPGHVPGFWWWGRLYGAPRTEIAVDPTSAEPDRVLSHPSTVVKLFVRRVTRNYHTGLVR